jgi:hypothetical protein
MNNIKENKGTKDIVIETPNQISYLIYKKLQRKPYHIILDIGLYGGELSKPFKRKKGITIIGLDILDDKSENFDNFIHEDFLMTTINDYKTKPDLILCNPPFGTYKNTNIPIPELFVDHIFKLFGENIPLVFIVPNWITDNSKRRMLKFQNFNITKQIQLEKNIFNDVLIHSKILFFNILFKDKKPLEYLHKEIRQTYQKKKSVAFNKEQITFINKNIDNFSKEVKLLIKEKYLDFPLN